MPEEKGERRPSLAGVGVCTSLRPGMAVVVVFSVFEIRRESLEVLSASPTRTSDCKSMTL